MRAAQSYSSGTQWLSISVSLRGSEDSTRIALTRPLQSHITITAKNSILYASDCYLIVSRSSSAIESTSLSTKLSCANFPSVSQPSRLSKSHHVLKSFDPSRFFSNPQYIGFHRSYRIPSTILHSSDRPQSKGLRFDCKEQQHHFYHFLGILVDDLCKRSQAKRP